MKGFFTGVTTGAIVGAAFGMMMLPQLDRRTQRTFRRAGKRVFEMAENSGGMMHWMK
ncbi:MAG: YtxH domain-containing protein [Clostridiaceae bacterium]